MSDKNSPVVNDESAEVIQKVQTAWEKVQKPVTYIGGLLIVVIGGWFAYKALIADPKEAKASDAIAKAQSYFAADSLGLALNGDGQSKGFLKIAKEYSGTNAGNLANYYAGVCYLNLGDYANAEKCLTKFSSKDSYVQARAYGLTGDALSEQKKFGEAAEMYKKAAGVNEKDDNFNAEYLFRAALIYSSELNKNAEAIELFKKIKDEYPRSQRGFEVDKYLARAGETQ